MNDASWISGTDAAGGAKTLVAHYFLMLYDIVMQPRSCDLRGIGGNRIKDIRSYVYTGNFQTICFRMHDATASGSSGKGKRVTGGMIRGRGSVSEIN
jgi:hypothetical protein